MKYVEPEIGKGCFVVSYFDGDEWVSFGQYHQAADAGEHAARVVGTTPLEEVKITFNIDLGENCK